MSELVPSGYTAGTRWSRALFSMFFPSMALLFGWPSPEPTKHRQQQPTSSEPHADLTTHPVPSDICQERFLEPFRLLTGTVSNSSSAAGAEHAQASPEQWDRKLTETVATLVNTMGPALDIDVMITTLPDPLDSGLGYQFDAQLQALRLGMEVETGSRLGNGRTVRYNRDRDWLPWNDRNVPKESHRASQECRRQLPGVVLFRGGRQPSPSLMILLVIGESPVVGVHAQAARQALSLSRRLQRRPDAGPLTVSSFRQPHARDVRILGPTFSGSASSLRQALDDFRRSGDCSPVRIISGTATGPEVPAILRHGGRLLCDPTSYQSTTVPEQSAICAFLYHARRAGAQIGRGSRPNAVDGVAMLQESGTEFGTTLVAEDRERHAASRCSLQPEIELSFPFHIATIRDAYEVLDSASVARAESDATIARHTSLEVSLRGTSRLDLEEPASQITKYAQDLALSNVLGEISREGVRWVGIQATDMTDAIFLARKIRDVAPDVRLAFFTADALLLHPSFRADLLGSLLVSPYPFLGSDDFWPRTRLDLAPGKIVQHSHASFPNAEAEGSFNAVLALRGVPADRLTEYAFIKPNAPGVRPFQPLPIWMSTVGRSGFVPLRATPALDCELTIYGNEDPPPASLCATGGASDPDAYATFNALRNLELHIDPDVTPPRLWNFVFAVLLLASVLHWLFERRVLDELGSEHFPSLVDVAREPVPTSLTDDDSRLDRCIVHTKWLLYAAFAQTSFLLAAGYFCAVYGIAMMTYARHDSRMRLGCALSISLLLFLFALVRTGSGFRRVHHQRRAFRTLLRGGASPIMHWSGLPGRLLVDGASEAPRRLHRWLVYATLWLGFADTHQPRRSIYVSYAQMRAMFRVGLLTALAFATLLGLSLAHTTDLARPGAGAVPALTLFVLRSLPLTNGVSPAVPLLLCLVCTWVWALGRMERLRLVHGLARMSPPDGVADCVSTPIRAVLFPDHDAASPCDHGFTDCERRLTNTILRPNGRSYFLAIAVIVFLPVVLFWLKRPTTLEPQRDTWLLFGALGVCAVLISATLVQLLHYWRALDRVLKRIMSHPIGPAFQRVSTAIRQDLDAQVSLLPADLLRLAACADGYESLMMGSGSSLAAELATRSSKWPPEETVTAALVALSRRRALGERPGTAAAAQQSGPPSAELARAQDLLGMQVIKTARSLTQKTLVAYWYLDASASWPRESRTSDIPPTASDDRLSVTSAKLSPAHQAWLQRAETYVASVVTILINRHVRQFRHFLYTTNGCSLLLLLAIASYPFEPHRTLMLCMWTLMLAVVGACLWVFVQLDRDPLLSHLAGDAASAGKVSWNRALANRVLLWVVAPLAGLLAAQYPAVAHELAKLIEPFTRALQ